MIKVKLKDETYEMPTKFEEIPLNKYMEIIGIDKDTTDTDRLSKILSILTEISLDDIKDININHVGAMSNHIQFLFKKTNHLLVEQVKIDNKWYGFNKNLKNLTFGEYIDLEEMSKGEKLNINLNVLMALLYRPIKRKHKETHLKKFIENYIYKKDDDYEIEDYESEELRKRAELFKNKMKMNVVLGAMFFFTILKLMYIENTKRSLTKKEMMKWMTDNMKVFGIDFSPIGDG